MTPEAEIEMLRSHLQCIQEEQLEVVRVLGWGGCEEFEWDAVVDAVREGVAAQREYNALLVERGCDCRKPTSSTPVPGEDV